MSVFARDAAALLLRDLRCLRREIDAYPDDASLWREMPGLTNTGGTLALHVTGNLQHYVGAVLGGTGYVRDRPAEFARRDVPRAELLERIDTTCAVIEATLPALPAARLDETYPEPVAGHHVRTGELLFHLATHLTYHLGQIDYHRRAVTATVGEIGAVSPRELRSARPA